MKDTWIGFLGVVLTVLAASVFAHAEMGGIREKLGRIDGILVGIEKRIARIGGTEGSQTSRHQTGAEILPFTGPTRKTQAQTSEGNKGGR